MLALGDEDEVFGSGDGALPTFDVYADGSGATLVSLGLDRQLFGSSNDNLRGAPIATDHPLYTNSLSQKRVLGPPEFGPILPPNNRREDLIWVRSV
jgi:hypothetical protein